jgi:hypothetical protein
MNIDPGLMTDSTGESIFGGQDVSLFTQKNFKDTYYNGTKPCLDCGLQLDPYTSLNTPYCASCTQRRAAQLVKNRMV